MTKKNKLVLILVFSLLIVFCVGAWFYNKNTNKVSFETEHTECLFGESEESNTFGWFPEEIKTVSWDGDTLKLVVSIEENCCGISFDGNYRIVSKK